LDSAAPGHCACVFFSVFSPFNENRREMLRKQFVCQVTRRCPLYEINIEKWFCNMSVNIFWFERLDRICCELKRNSRVFSFDFTARIQFRLYSLDPNFHVPYSIFEEKIPLLFFKPHCIKFAFYLFCPFFSNMGIWRRKLDFFLSLKKSNPNLFL